MCYTLELSFRKLSFTFQLQPLHSDKLSNVPKCGLVKTQDLSRFSVWGLAISSSSEKGSESCLFQVISQDCFLCSHFSEPQKRPAMHHGRCILEGKDKAKGDLAIVHRGTFVSVLRPLCGLTRANWSHNNGWIMDVNKSFCSEIFLARIRSTHCYWVENAA